MIPTGLHGGVILRHQTGGIMAKNVIYEPSRTLMEFRLLPGETTRETVISEISLQAPLVFTERELDTRFLNTPIVAAAMQSVSGVTMAIELAKLGGVAFIYCSQPIEAQAGMIRSVKRHKAGFVEPETVSPDTRISDLHDISTAKGFSTFPVVSTDGTLMGLMTKNDYDVSRHGAMPVSERMIPRNRIVVGAGVEELNEANILLMDSHQPVLPVVDEHDRLKYLVFRKDIRDHLDNPYELVDTAKRLMAAAAINTHDYEDRVPALVDAGVDVVAVDSSDGYSVFQKRTIQWIRENHPDLPVIGGNVITGDGFTCLVDAGAQAIKVGMGGGSICITQEQKGTGRGLATAIIKVVETRDQYHVRTGRYIPVIADGGIVTAKDIVVALALGADYVMMGRYFARMEESPTERVRINNRVMKPYWGEGSSRAREWKAKRYHHANFVEGVEGFVEYAGKLRDNMEETLNKIRAAMSSCGVRTVQELHERAELELVSALSIREGQVHDIYLPGSDGKYRSVKWGV